MMHYDTLRSFSQDRAFTERLVWEAGHIPPKRACFLCGKVLDARAGFIETVTQPDGTRRDFCTWRCIRDQLKDGAPL